MNATFSNYGNVFDKKEIRNNFVRKTFSLVGVQLLITTVLVTILTYSTILSNIIDKFSGIIFLGFIILSLAISFNRKILRDSNSCFIALTAYSCFMSCNLSVLLRDISLSLILTGLFSTISVCGGLIYYAMTTKTSFGSLKALGYVLLFSLFNLFFALFIGTNIIYTCLSGIIFGVYLIIDIQRLMGNKELKFGIDEYGFAALNIYIDIVNIFIKIMEVLKESDKKKNN